MSSPVRRIIGPFNRVEGDLEVEIEIDNEHVSAAWVNASLYRGFEQILRGKDPRDALVYTPRICGICSVSQSVAAAQALAQAQQLSPAENGQLATNLVLAAENLADHLTHFYLFFMPDFARESYSERPWYAELAPRFAAHTGTVSSTVLQARAAFLHITGLLAGKWPHSLALQPGGTTRSVEPQERMRLLSIIGAFRQFMETTLFNDTLEAVTNLQTNEALVSWADEHRQSDFSRFLHIADDVDLQQLGKSHDRFMSYGAYTQTEGHLFNRGVWQDETLSLNTDAIREDISHSWLLGDQEGKHPAEGITEIDDQMQDGYSWCKAPRLDNHPMEVGALARQVVHGHPLIRQLVQDSGGNVRNRVIARLLELALIVPAMEDWVHKLQPREPFCHHASFPEEVQSAGLVEAARGSLGHWLHIRKGRIQNYQIIAPTTWNFSPRDSNDQPGTLEQALVGTYVGEQGRDAVAIQHIVRSFDPCMVCTVH